MLESSKSLQTTMPKWGQNPSKIDENSVKKSRSEKGRPKIKKNRGLERPRAENLSTTVLRASRFRPRGVPTNQERHRGLARRIFYNFFMACYVYNENIYLFMACYVDSENKNQINSSWLVTYTVRKSDLINCPMPHPSCTFRVQAFP